MVEYEVWLKSSETAPTKAKKWISHPLGSQISCHAWKTSVEFCIAICDTCWILCAVQRPFHLFWRRSACCREPNSVSRVGGEWWFCWCKPKMCGFQWWSWWDTQLTLHRSGHVHQILLSLYSLHNILQLNSGERIHSAKAYKCQIKMMRHLLTS